MPCACRGLCACSSKTASTVPCERCCGRQVKAATPSPNSAPPSSPWPSLSTTPSAGETVERRSRCSPMSSCKTCPSPAGAPPHSYSCALTRTSARWGSWPEGVLWTWGSLCVRSRGVGRWGFHSARFPFWQQWLNLVHIFCATFVSVSWFFWLILRGWRRGRFEEKSYHGLKELSPYQILIIQRAHHVTVEKQTLRNPFCSSRRQWQESHGTKAAHMLHCNYHRSNTIAWAWPSSACCVNHLKETTGPLIPLHLCWVRTYTFLIGNLPSSSQQAHQSRYMLQKTWWGYHFHKCILIESVKMYKYFNYAEDKDWSCDLLSRKQTFICLHYRWSQFLCFSTVWLP